MGGFCCVCDWNTNSIRGGVGCGIIDWFNIKRTEYSYCLRFDPPSWTVNELGSPFLDYSVEVGISKPTSPQATSRDEAGYVTSYITLDSHTPTKTDGDISAHIVGDFESGGGECNFIGTSYKAFVH